MRRKVLELIAQCLGFARYGIELRWRSRRGGLRSLCGHYRRDLCEFLWRECGFFLCCSGRGPVGQPSVEIDSGGDFDASENLARRENYGVRPQLLAYRA